ncbi:MAG: thiamine pyrophosphate-binding protein [Pseudomonadota bacterium]
MSDKTAAPWKDDIFDAMKTCGVEVVGYVPDAGHAHVIRRCVEDNDIQDVALTTEEEGVALAAGAWLGGKKSALLMQSSGVGNCVNMLSMRETGRYPLVILVTMRGEWAEFNPWQVPMGSKTQEVLELCGFKVERVTDPDEVGETVAAAIDFAYAGDIGVAVLISQKLIGAKTW